MIEKAKIKQMESEIRNEIPNAETKYDKDSNLISVIINIDESKVNEYIDRFDIAESFVVRFERIEKLNNKVTLTINVDLDLEE